MLKRNVRVFGYKRLARELGELCVMLGGIIAAIILFHPMRQI